MGCVIRPVRSGETPGSTPGVTYRFQGRLVQTDVLESPPDGDGWSWVEPDGQRCWVGYPARSDQEMLIKENFEGRIGSHLRADCTMNMIQRAWFWPGMKVQVRLWVGASKGCQSWKLAWFWQCTLLQTLIPDGPWNQITMDLLGLLPETARENKHVLVVADSSTKWVKGLPGPQHGTESAAQVSAHYTWIRGTALRV